jgi:phosphoglycerate dehydrogenase-like enzyme
MTSLTLSDLLFFKPAWERLRERLCGMGLSGEPWLLEQDGRLTRADRPATAGRGAIRAAWASPDTYVAKQINTFLDHALSAGADWVQAGSAGVDNPRFAQLDAAGIRLTTSDAMVPSIAELVLAGVLDHYQRGPERRAVQASHRWTLLPFREIAGTRWLVIGFGAIGREIGPRARAFHAHVTGVRRSGGADDAADQIITPEALIPALGEADVVVLSVPLSDATRHTANTGFFAAMKKGAVIVNVGRGGLLDETALIASLDGGHVGHAILDVVTQEPLPADSPIWNHPKIALTCHVAGLGDGLIARSDQLFLDNLIRYREGRPLRLAVDRSLFGAA